MAIVSRSYDELEPYKGRFRTRCRYVFDDGRRIVRGPMFVLNEEEAASRLAALEARANKQMMELDAEEVARTDRDIIGETGHAMSGDVAKAYLIAAMNTENPLDAYRKLKRAQDHFASQGWTGAMVMTNLGITVDRWADITTRWQYLNSNADTLNAYRLVIRNDPGIGKV